MIHQSVLLSHQLFASVVRFVVYNSKLSLGLSDQASQLPWYLSPLSFETCCMDQVSVKIVTRHTKIRSIYIQLPYILNHHCPSSSMSSSSSTSSSPSSHHLHQSISNINFTMISDEKKSGIVYHKSS